MGVLVDEKSHKRAVTPHARADPGTTQRTISGQSGKGVAGMLTIYGGHLDRFRMVPAPAGMFCLRKHNNSA